MASKKAPAKTDPLKDAGGGKTKVEQGGESAPRLPHERDESADQQPAMEPSNARIGRAAQADAQRGVADTTKGAELDATYHQVRKGGGAK